MSSSPTELWAVVLAGGVGSRFWPVSTPHQPKQLLPLASDRPLIQDTVRRILPLVPTQRIRILAGAEIGGAIIRTVPELSQHNLLNEPLARGTAPVLAWAAHEIAKTSPDAVMISLHADHAIAPENVFRDQLARVAAAAASEQRLFTLGVRPSRAETGYGYIRVGAALGEPDTFEVAEFVEKPDVTTAEGYVRDGGYLWNSGIFILPVRLFLEEIRAHTPELAPLLPLLDQGDVAGFFRRAPTLTIDEGVLERSSRIGVAPAAFAWDDVGAWDAVGRNRTADASGNVAVGDAHMVDSSNCIAWAEDGAIVVFGGEDLVVVRANGVTFVAPRARTADLKELLRVLPESLRHLKDE
jgi:mannose-1-phosphate guanylyltransferase